MSIDILLSRLNKSKRTSSNSWLACCPAHDDKLPSLTVRDANDGRILIHCFAGCSTEDVLRAIGMEFKDIMPEKITHHAKPERTRIYATDALRIIRNEARIVLMAAYDIRKGVKINQENITRVELAMERINDAVEAANV